MPLGYGQGFEAWTTMMKKAMKSAPDASLKGIFWMQGETDADTKDLSEKYKTNLKKLIKGIRSETGVESTFFYW